MLAYLPVYIGVTGILVLAHIGRDNSSNNFTTQNDTESLPLYTQSKIISFFIIA